MAIWRPVSLRGKLLLFSIGASLALGVALGIAWLYFQVNAITAEIDLDNRNRIDTLQSVLADEFSEKHSTGQAAKHVGHAFFKEHDIIAAEITTPGGTILAAKDGRNEGRRSSDPDEISDAVKDRKPISIFWALRKPSGLDGKVRISGLSPFDWRPKVQEFTSPVFVNGKVKVVVHIYLSLNRLTAGLRKLSLLAILIVLSVTLISGLITFFFMDRLIYRPILALDEVAEKITAGDLNARAALSGEDEFTELGRRFNLMADSLIHARFEAATDSLTGLFNYRHLQSYLGTQIALAGRYRRGLTVAMLDIDHFKNVNDLYGHQTGDDVLRMAVEFIKSQLRQVDYTARYGGEEFVIVMPETSEEAAVKVMERIVAGFPDNVYIERMGIRNPVFVSIGVADYPFCGEDPTNLLAAADMALLLAKRRGRNQVSYFRAVDQRAG